MAYNGAGKLMIDYMDGTRKVNSAGKGHIQFSTYVFALRCKHCGTWRAKETKNLSSARFKCFVCNKETKLRMNGQYGFNCDYRKFKTMCEAKEFVIRVNGQRKDEL